MADKNQEITIIPSQMFFQGEIHVDHKLNIEGEAEGVIRGAGSVHILSSGNYKGDIHARDIEIEGKVQGNLRAQQAVQLRQTASLTGDIDTANVEISKGARFNGSIVMK